MDWLQKLAFQFPMVSIMALVWWTHRKDYMDQIKKYRDSLAKRDEQLDEAIKAFDRLVPILEVLKDRVQR